MNKKFYDELFESPDEIRINGAQLNYDNKDIAQRSFIVFPSSEIWVSKIGETHDNVYDYPIESPTLSGTLAGRVWLEHNVISFWHSPVSLFGKKFLYYLNLLEDRLLSYNINMKDLMFDTYESWRGIGKKICGPKLMSDYYADEWNTPLDSYETYINKMNKWITMCFPEDSTKIVPSGSPKTAWDSKNSIRFRQLKSTSESFYPTIFNK